MSTSTISKTFTTQDEIDNYFFVNHQVQNLVHHGNYNTVLLHLVVRIHTQCSSDFIPQSLKAYPACHVSKRFGSHSLCQRSFQFRSLHQGNKGAYRTVNLLTNFSCSIQKLKIHFWLVSTSPIFIDTGEKRLNFKLRGSFIPFLFARYRTEKITAILDFATSPRGQVNSNFTTLTVIIFLRPIQR